MSLWGGLTHLAFSVFVSVCGSLVDIQPAGEGVTLKAEKKTHFKAGAPVFFTEHGSLG